MTMWEHLAPMIVGVAGFLLTGYIVRTVLGNRRARFLAEMQTDTQKRLLDKFGDFVKYVNSNPKASRRRDTGHMLAETVVAALADLKACVVNAAKNEHALMFRMLPPPA